MIHIINKYNRQYYSDVLRNMFQLRHKIFVEQKGWNQLAQEDGLEIDQFDTDETIYFLKLDENSNILGGMRLVPTVVDTQLGTIFKDWCDFKPAPVGKNTYEWSRYFIADKKYRSPAGYPVHYELFFSILEFAVYRGIRNLTGFLEAVTLPRLNALPWDIEYLGNMVTYGGVGDEPKGRGAAVMVGVNERMLRITKRMKGIKKPYLALPIGDMGPARQIACTPEVCFRYLTFLEEHPEHANMLAAMSSMIIDSPKDRRAAIIEVFDGIAQDEAMAGFDASFAKVVAPTSYSLSVQ
ncbi:MULTISPECIES: acyl-homoserine-lactone synthase [Kordiimonas]|jgi:acyl-homoserine lactone synthase|uniref:acyl-homoserine-lactone synthase n=1 Tax=Kordiimonas TaxID=288021 RepID=UPI00257EDABE|nr:acyl-homoserine-lactone synthase [Kordiimonas sp. UBA4487]